MNYAPFKKNIIIDVFLYTVLLLLATVFRYLVLQKFGFIYTDSDQTIMWLGLKEYAAGVFHEPRFYGQSYNSMLEAFIAVPLYKMGIPAYKALPLITSVLALSPYIIISFFTFLKKSPKTALVILSIPLLLPVEYSLITTIPRGFVTGLFVAGAGCISLFYPQAKRSFFVLGFTGVLGSSLNANAVLLFLPCIIFLFLDNIKNKLFYLYTCIGIALGIVIHLYVNYFYILHPFYDFHKIEISFSFIEVLTSIKKLDPFFNDVTPVFWKTGFLVLIMFICISTVFFFKKKYKKAAIIAGIPFFIFLTLGINKVHDGTEGIFYSYSRMYLAIPVLLAVSLSFLKIQTGNFFYIYLIIPFVFVIYQVNMLDTAIAKNLIPSKEDKVAVTSVADFTNNCVELKDICNKYHIDLVVIINHPYCDFYNYGCPAIIDNFPKTIRPSYERRTWRLTEDENKIYTNLLLIDIGRTALSNPGILEAIPGEAGMFVIKNNNKRIIDLFNTLPVHYRPYK